MSLSLKTKLLGLILGASMAATGLAANLTAADPIALLIVNNTDYPSDANVYGTSTKHPTAAHGQQSLPWGIVRVICHNVSPCNAEVYLANGSKFLPVHLDLKAGGLTIDDSVSTDGNYTLSGDTYIKDGKLVTRVTINPK